METVAHYEGPIRTMSTSLETVLSSVEGINCGCGTKVEPGWLNIDRANLRGSNAGRVVAGDLAVCGDSAWYLCHDLTCPLPFPSNSVGAAFSEHFIEHLHVEDAIKWLSEVNRVLQPGAHLRVTTPDLARYMAGYADPSEQFFERHRTKLVSLPSVPHRRAWMVNQIFYGWGHRWIYDFEEMRFIGHTAGFEERDIRRCEFRVGGASSTAKLDHPNRAHETLYVEMLK